MKKVIISIFILSLLLSGCTEENTTNKGNKDEMQQQQEDNKEIQQNQENGVMEEFSDLTSNDPTEKEVINFIDNNIEKVSKDKGTNLVLELEKIQEKNIQKRSDRFVNNDIQKKMNQAFDKNTSSYNINNIKDEEVKKLLQEIKSNGYKIMMSEGMFYPIIDYEIYKDYKSNVSQPMKEYIDIKALESNNIATSDAALVISWGEVLNRTIIKEKFIAEYQEFENIKEIKRQYLYYSMLYMYGTANTPAFDRDNKLNDKLKASYSNIDFNKDSMFLNELEEYIKVLKENNYKRNEEVDKTRNNIFKKIENEMGVSLYNQ